MKNFWLWLLWGWPAGLLGQVIQYAPDPVYTISSMYSSVFSNAFTGTINPACLAGAGRAELGIYASHIFPVPGLRHIEMAGRMGLPWVGAGISLRHQGGAEFRSSLLSLGAGKHLGDVDIGISLHYYQQSAGALYRGQTFTAGAGASWQVNKKTRLGIAIQNPAGGYIGSNRAEKLAARYSAGLAYDLSPQFCMGAAIEKAEGRSPDMQVYLLYNWQQKFYCSAGLQSATGSFWLGAGFAWKRFHLELSSRFHPRLGPGTGLLLLISNKKEKE